MPIRRDFLDWDQPALPAVVRLLRSENPSRIDFSDLIAVFPGRQAGRRFLELLTLECGGRINPPQIVTVGSLPELLYSPQRPFASPLTQQLAWVRALRSLPQETLQRIVRDPPDEEDSLGWMRLGEMLSRQHSELAADRLRFADVARLGPSLTGFDEAPRWHALAEVQRSYLTILDKLGLWDRQTARLVAIDQRECRTAHNIVTVGTVDLNRTVRSMLEQVGDRVTTCIHAPASLADGFDELGCLLPDRWTEMPVELHSEQVLIREDAAGQCDAVIRCLEELQGRFALDEIVVGVPDESLTAHLQGSLAAWNVPAFHPVERQLAATGPYRLLEAVADYLDGGLSTDFAALIRHPDVSIWLSAQGLPSDWLDAWDEHYCQHLPRMTDLMLGDDPVDVIALQVRDHVRRLLVTFDGGLRPLSGWSVSVREFFREAYTPRTFSLDSRDDQCERAALKEILAGFESHAEVPEGLDVPVSAVEALRLTLHQISRNELYRVEGEPAIHLAGWLEMPLDDAPVAVITTLNEGVIPSSVNHDLFLPDRLRSHLGIENNARRYARDLHALLSVIHSRKVVRAICARRDSNGDPLAPSRLLLAAPPEEIARRVQEFYDAPLPETSWALPPQTLARVSGFQIPPPQPHFEPLKSLRVTAFRDFLSSPYRFYLRHILRLEEVSDNVWELDPLDFGTLLHSVLESFGDGPLRHSADAREIESFLTRKLAELAEIRFGSRPLPAVRVQLQQSRIRLGGFARWQAEWRKQGWEIHAVEQKHAPTFPLTLEDGRSLLLSGRIDRIDYHPATGAWAVFDYKSSDQAKDPESDHRRGSKGNKTWFNLQLPLYRHLARARNVEGDVKLGYIVLPSNPADVTAKFADWTTADLASADMEAKRIAKAILDGEFWKVLDAPCGVLTEFDDVCLTGVSGQEVLV